jgi:hypothetical protein
MSINKHNYEAFFLDYSEGSLSAEKVAELLLFLEENPLLKEELENFDLLELDPTVDVSFNKEFLKVAINEDNVEGFIISSIEGVNTEVDEKELIDYVNENKESKQLFNRYNNTILTVPEAIFPKKSSLKKKSRVVVLYPLIGIAASLLIFFMLEKNVEKQEYKPQGIIAIEKSIYIEDKPDVITNEIQIIQEKIEEEANNVTRIKNRPIPEIYVAPRNNYGLAIDLTDSVKVIPKKIEIFLAPEDLIVTNDSANDPKIDSVVSFDEPSDTDLTFNEWTNNQIRNRVLNQDSEDVSKIKNDEVLAAIAGVLNKVSKQEIAYNNESNENYTTKGFSVGNFEFSRTKRKKF